VQLDPAKKPAVVGRALAAVATLGLSVAATGKADTARDACAIVPASPAKRGAQASTASVRP
jgi:hypothetical protein